MEPPETKIYTLILQQTYSGDLGPYTVGINSGDLGPYTVGTMSDTLENIEVNVGIQKPQS